MREFFFEKRGLYYRCNTFNPQKETLFFVHGVSGSSSAWHVYERAFEKKYNVISLDLRGHGKSIKFNRYEDYRIEKFSDDLRELLKYCGVSKCIIISNSFGALVAIDFIGKYQKMVSSAIFIGPHFAVNKMWPMRIIKPFLAFIIKRKPTFLSKNKGGHIDYSKYLNTGDWNVQRTVADITNTGFWIYCYAVAHTCNFAGEKILEKIKIPTLIIHGAKDTIFPVKYGKAMAEKIKNSNLVIMHDIDHIIVLNRPQKTIEIIKNFLAGKAL